MQRVKHMVIFCLKSGKDSAETKKFLNDGKSILTQIPGVESFDVLDQISAKCDYDFGFTMEFKDQEVYDAYSNHPLHVGFVNERWLTQVSRFQEIDFHYLP